MDGYNNNGIRGQIEYVDAPADMPTMLAHVEQNIGRILRDAKDKHFLMIKFMQEATQEGRLILPERDDWYTVFQRRETNNANTWHVHNGVALFSPTQDEASVPTGVSLKTHFDDTRIALGMTIEEASKPNTDNLALINRYMSAFWTNDISDSGHVLIVPDNVLHARHTAAEKTDAPAGILHRLTLKNI